MRAAATAMAVVLGLLAPLAGCEEDSGGAGAVQDTASDGSSADGSVEVPDGGPGDADQADADAPDADAPDADAPDADAPDADAPDADAPDADTAEETDAAADTDTALPACEPGTRWEPGVEAFREVTVDWGLGAIAPEGTRLSVTDVDRDGRADLLVRRSGGKPDPTAEGQRQTWLLRNTDGGFEDVTASSGILATRMDHDPAVGRPNEVWATADVDGDGDLDLYSGLTTADAEATLGETSEILLNQGDGTFALGPEDNPVRRQGIVDAPGGATFVDYDRDGHVDLWLPQASYSTDGGTFVVQDRLLRGDGTGRFEDVTGQAGLTTWPWVQPAKMNDGEAHTRAWSSAACDLNDDGWPELLAASYGRSPNHLWQGAEQGFTNRSVASGYAYDADMTWSDNYFAQCYCQDAPGAEGCGDVPAPPYACNQDNWNHESDRMPWRLGGNSGSTMCGDVDNDGDVDLLTTEIRHWWAGSGSDPSEILVNSGQYAVSFERPGREILGLEVPHPTAPMWDEGHMTGALFDFDNDGRLDVYIGASDYPGNRGLLYHQDAALSFTPVPPDDGFLHNRSHGVAVADFDRDGDLDLVVGHSRFRCDAGEPNNCYETAAVRAFENLLGDQGHWIQLDLEATAGSNTAAIGARVTVEAGGLTQVREVDGGHGHYGMQRDRVLHAGLGDACQATVTVRWPGPEQAAETHVLQGDRRWRLVQGEAPQGVE